MKSYSEAYKKAMALGMRGQPYVRIRFEQVNVDAATDGTWASNGELAWSETDTLDYNYEYGQNYASMELNRTLLDGTSQIMPDDYNVTDGYISSAITNGNGNFSTNPVLTREFSVAHSLLGLTLTFDSRNDEWPMLIHLTLYNGGTAVFDEEVTVTASTVSISTMALTVDKIVLTFKKMLPYRRARMESVLYGIIKTFENADISSTSQSHDVDPLSRRLPQEKFLFTVFDLEHDYDPENPQGIYEYIDLQAPVSISHGHELPDGTVEWLKADGYKLSGRPSTKGFFASFQATGLIGSMTETFYKGKLGTKNFYDMAEEVLLDAGLTPTKAGENPWVIHSSLKTMYTNAVLPIDTHANCLQLIAHACRCKLYTDDDNIIHVEPFGLSGLENSDFALDFNSALSDGPVLSKIEPLKAVTVAKYSYSADGNETELYAGETTSDSAHIEFSGLAQNVRIQVTGGMLISSVIYGRAADLVLSAGTKTITVTGVQLKESTIITTYPVAEDGDVDEEKNPLITNDVMATALAAHVIEYLALRNTYDVDYRGNPELETGDVIGLRTQYSDEIDGLILTDEISFNGSVSGKVKVKALL